MDEERRRRRYRYLLWLFPPGFRSRHGREMTRVFDDMHAEWRARWGRAGAGFWASMAVDSCRHAAAAWIDTVRRADEHEHQGGVETMRSILGDIRYALRQILRHPLYAGTVVLLVAVGIAGNAAVFRVFNGLFLRPLPFEAAERLVDIDERADAWNLEYTGVHWSDFEAWRDGNRTFESMAVYTVSGRNLADGSGAERVTVVEGSHELDDVLRLTPMAGRFWTPEEDVPGAPRVAMLSHGFWTDRFAADPGALGRTVTLDGEPYEVIGVLPAEARFLQGAELWAPLRGQPGGWYLEGLGRLADAVTPERAQEDLTAIHKAMIPQQDVNEITTPVVAPLRDRFLGESRLGAGLLLGAVGVVLLIACANIAGLVMARSVARADELSVRRALGAPRGRIARQLLIESLVLGVAGGAVGLTLGLWGSGGLVALAAAQFPPWVTFEVDLRFLCFVVAATVGATVLFALFPALRAPAGAGTLAPGRSTASRGRRRGMELLVASEVSLAVVLLVVGGLSLLDARRLAQADPGFRPAGLVAYSFQLPTLRYPDGEARRAFLDDLLPRLAEVPGVEAVTAANMLPFSSHQGWFFSVESAPERAADEPNPVVLTRWVTPGYFDAVGVQVLSGRAFDDFDGRDEGNGVVMVNEEFVRSHLAGDSDALGRRIAPGTHAPDEGDWLTIVGVVRDARHYGVDEDMRPGVFLPHRQYVTGYGQIGVRVSGDAAAAMAGIRSAALEVDPEVPPYGMVLMTDRFGDTLRTRRASAWMFGLFAGSALLLAVAGLYGVISYGVGQRRQEISIRMAMGARASEVLGQVVRQGMAMVVLGLVVGLGLAAAAARPLSSLLVGVRPYEPSVYVTVTLVLLAVAAVANYVPARRAAGFDPMRALRGE